MCAFRHAHTDKDWVVHSAFNFSMVALAVSGAISSPRASCRGARDPRTACCAMAAGEPRRGLVDRVDKFPLAPAASISSSLEKRGHCASKPHGQIAYSLPCASRTSPGPASSSPNITVRPLPRVLLIHTGGTLGMDSGQSYEPDETGHEVLRAGTGGRYHETGTLKPGKMLHELLRVVPELKELAQLDLRVAFNSDSSNVGPKEWVLLGRLLDAARESYDAFMIIHGTDTMAYTASAVSLMLAGFRKPIVFTGSQLPLSKSRSDARQNLIDALSCAVSPLSAPYVPLQEVAVCFGGRLMRGNRTRKVNSSAYQAFDSPSFPYLASMGVELEWNRDALLKVEGTYHPRFEFVPSVIRVPIVPGADPSLAYGDLVDRGVAGIVLESFGVGNMPDTATDTWLPWIKSQMEKGLDVAMISQCSLGPLRPELYHSGAVALALGVHAGPQMIPECAAVKMMLSLGHEDVRMGTALAGEL